MKSDFTENWNDYELLYLIHQKDENALQLLLQKYRPHCRTLIRQNCPQFCPGYDSEDLLLLAEWKIIEACDSYNEGKNCSFYTYMTLCVMRKLVSLNRKIFRENALFPPHFSLDQTLQEDHSIYLVDLLENNQPLYNPSYYVLYHSLLHQAADFLTTLNSRERQVWNCMCAKMSYQQAASLLHISSKQYDNTVYRLKKKFLTYLRSG